MTTLQDVSLDTEGFMVDPNAWNPEIAEALAEEEGLAPLNERHWAVIDFVRKDWGETGESPTLRRITKQSGVNTKELYALFPKGPAKKVARVAGLGKPKGCI
ncbi:MAG: TusE/DsrC/DsvC family sulfur relay protein [Anaerolineales bacterium]|nr:TusE/DsrC/DsvC family sulfur relay protein [Anaerolineales bacterium]MCB9127932.1 TusE/DsrC/DsvC family sulfur relay protein [Ardenticatenales bacterium]MCB9171694.1 TusE/DsrC/DsvC family sulfur relay protein [Ardenticatenales bacterium]